MPNNFIKKENDIRDNKKIYDKIHYRKVVDKPSHNKAFGRRKSGMSTGRKRMIS